MARNLHTWKVCWGTFLPNSLFDSLFVTVFWYGPSATEWHLPIYTSKNREERRHTSKPQPEPEPRIPEYERLKTTCLTSRGYCDILASIKLSHNCGERNRFQT